LRRVLFSLERSSELFALRSVVTESSFKKPLFEIYRLPFTKIKHDELSSHIKLTLFLKKLGKSSWGKVSLQVANHHLSIYLSTDLPNVPTGRERRP
jgi:hypothetical protein